MRILPVLLLLFLLLPGLPPRLAAAAETYAVYGADRFFKLEWETVQRGERQVIQGRIANEFGIAARWVRLRVEGLDAGGGVVSSTIGHVPGIVPPGGRVWFEVPVTGSAATWRLSVLSFDWLPGHGMLRLPP